MMLRSQGLISLLLAVLYGGMMLFGQGLHELVDCGHFHGHSPHGQAIHGQAHFQAAADAHEEQEQPCHQHCSHHANQAHEAEDPRSGEDDLGSLAVTATDDVGLHASDCPICQFHGQGQLRAPINASLEQRVPTVAVSRTPSLRFTEFSLGVHSPRAPPA
jgi:hypothetical protein